MSQTQKYIILLLTEKFIEHIRVCCDWMNLTWMIDEYTDASEGGEVRKQKDTIMDAMHNPHEPRPEGEWVVGEVARQ